MESIPETTGPAVLDPTAALSQDAREKLEKYIEAEEGEFNRLSGPIGTRDHGDCGLCFVLPPLRRVRDRARPRPAAGARRHGACSSASCCSRWRTGSVTASAGGITCWRPRSAATILYVLSQGAYFGDRATMPTQTDYVVGVVFIVLLLEGTRRATGVDHAGRRDRIPALRDLRQSPPNPWTHRGYALEDIVAHLYMTLEGIFGTTVDVSSSLIILFTIFGAVLQHSGAGKFFIDFSFAAHGRQAQRRRPRGGALVFPAGRTVGLRRRHHGDDRHRRLSAAGKSRLRKERRRRVAGGRRARRHHLAAGAGRRRVPDRRVPQDLVFRRDPDGDDSDRALLLRHLDHGGSRRAQAGRRRRAARGEGRSSGRSPSTTGSTSAR